MDRMGGRSACEGDSLHARSFTKITTMTQTIITTPSQDGLHSGAHKVPKENWRSQGPNNTSGRISISISIRIGHGDKKKGGRGIWE